MKGILSAIVFTPLIGAIIVAMIPKNKEQYIKWVALGIGFIGFTLSVITYASYNFQASGFQFIEKASWIKSVGINYHLAADGISLPLLVLANLLLVCSLAYSFTVTKRVKEYFIFILILAGSMSGVFVALDYILFYIFWELGLVPMYFLIGVWGGARREYAAIKFFLYTLFGSVFMFLGILGLYFYSGSHTFSIIELAKFSYPYKVQVYIFLGIFLGLAIKLPVFPFHTWLPDAHVEAPTAASVLLAGILLKMGGYGFIRILIPSVPQAFKYFVPLMAGMAIISIIYGAYLAMGQDDLKKMVAYSSISHMGFVILGFITLNRWGVNGAVFQMVSHGLTTGMMFMLVGMVHDRYHTRRISELSGLVWQIPALAGVIIFTSFASAGLPALSGFIGEVHVIIGVVSVSWGYAIAAGIGIILTFGYITSMIAKINLKQPKKVVEVLDLNIREIIILSPFVFLVIFLGIYPGPLLKLIEGAVLPLLK